MLVDERADAAMPLGEVAGDRIVDDAPANIATAVARLGGHVAVASRPGEGTTVTCVFPARPSDEKPVGQTSSDEASEAAVRAANGRSA